MSTRNQISSTLTNKNKMKLRETGRRNLYESKPPVLNIFVSLLIYLPE